MDAALLLDPFASPFQTAAHHLEAMRDARAPGMGPGVGLGGRGSRGSSPSVDRLLRESVEDLSRRAEGEASAVRELLEDLRYESEGLD